MSECYPMPHDSARSVIAAFGSREVEPPRALDVVGVENFVEELCHYPL
jgi:hypothetical protein